LWEYIAANGTLKEVSKYPLFVIIMGVWIEADTAMEWRTHAEKRR
jgi:hypothetical protein